MHQHTWVPLADEHLFRCESCGRVEMGQPPWVTGEEGWQPPWDPHLAAPGEGGDGREAEPAG